MIYVGIDNGVSGSIGIINGDKISYDLMPVKRELNYTKSKRWINRIDVKELRQLFFNNSSKGMYRDNYLIGIERPMVNPGRFQATASALRALESVLIIIEEYGMSYQYLDSKEWQKVLLPKDLKGDELKEASLSIGKRLFPKINFKGFKDADGLLISEFLRRTHEQN